MVTPVPTVRPSRYTVTCVPPDTSDDAHVWALYVEEQRDGRWVVTDGVCWLDGTLTFQDGPYDECLHDLDAAPQVIVNGRTVAEALGLAETWNEAERD
jgi:hypothetical protein